jgi:WD40 repeat protein
MLTTEKKLHCQKGHKWNLMKPSALLMLDGHLICPKCEGVLKTTLLRPSIKLEKELLWGPLWRALAVILLVFVSFIGFIYLSVSRSRIIDMSVSQDGKILAIARTSMDQSGKGNIEVWDLHSMQRLTRYNPTGNVSAVAIEPNQTEVLLAQQTSASDPSRGGSKFYVQQLARLNFQPGSLPQPIRTLPFQAKKVHLAEDRIFVAFEKGLLQFFDRKTGTELGKLSLSEEITVVEYVLKSGLLLVGTTTGHLLVIDLKQQKITSTIPAHIGLISAVAIRGKTLITAGGLDRSVKRWDLDKQIELQAIETDFDWVTSLAIHPDLKRIVIGGGSFNDAGQAQIMNIETGKVEMRFHVKTNSVTRVHFVQDGRTLIASSGQAMSLADWDKQSQIHLWDIESGTERPLVEAKK